LLQSEFIIVYILAKKCNDLGLFGKKIEFTRFSQYDFFAQKYFYVLQPNLNPTHALFFSTVSKSDTTLPNKITSDIMVHILTPYLSIPRWGMLRALVI